ncbi:MAG: helix-turn-helix domain-containing protein [Spirochaetaceae bacterium]|nr:helix-turn-helix domain-containing protein [Spirochaetaceae bacterium]
MENAGSGSLCPRVEAAFQLLARKWVGLIIRALLPGELCFSALQRALPSLSARVLAVRMKELEAEGIAYRQVVDDGKLRVIYCLTEKGRALEPALNAIAEWAGTWESSVVSRKSRD